MVDHQSERSAALSQPDALDLSGHVYVDSLGAYLPADQVNPDGTVKPLGLVLAGRIREIVEGAMEADPKVREVFLEEQARKREADAA